GRADVVFHNYPAHSLPPLEGYLRLAAEGPELSAVDATCGVLLLDGSWRWAAAMEKDFRDVPPRSLHGWRTAYPRVAKRGTDPGNGLASIEAIFLAYHILGRPTAGNQALREVRLRDLLPASAPVVQMPSPPTLPAPLPTSVS